MVAGSFTIEIESSVEAKRLWNATVKDSHNFLPKQAPGIIAGITLLQGDGGVGTIRQIDFTAANKDFSYVKEKVEVVDEANLVYGYSHVEGGVLGTKVASVSYKVKYSPKAGGGSIVTYTCNYDSLPGVPHNEAKIAVFIQKREKSKHNLVRMGVGTAENSVALEFEASFIQSEEHRPKRFSVSPDDNLKIPVIDLEKSSTEEVEKACREWGFFHLINHGFPEHLLRRLESAADDFFSLPLEEKRQVSRDAQNSLGYFNTELTKNVRDWKEVFDFMPREETQLPASVDPHDLTTYTVKNQWPDAHPDFREACLAYGEAARELSFKLLELIARSLGLPDNRLNEYFKDDISLMRLNCYPACPAPELALGVGRHKDPGGLTLLYQDQVGGLEVKCKDNGQWLPAQPLPASFVVNVGDCIQVWSNDRYESVEHRVVVNDNRRRLSIPFFFNPSHYVMVKPLEEMVSEENPPKYREYNWGKFYKQKKDSNFKNLGVENLQIYHFRIRD